MNMLMLTGQMGARGKMPSSHTLQNQHYGDDTVWQAMREIDHKVEMKSMEMDIKKLQAPVDPGPSRSRGFSRSQRGSASGDGPGMTTADIINRRYS